MLLPPGMTPIQKRPLDYRSPLSTMRSPYDVAMQTGHLHTVPRLAKLHDRYCTPSSKRRFLRLEINPMSATRRLPPLQQAPPFPALFLPSQVRPWACVVAPRQVQLTAPRLPLPPLPALPSSPAREMAPDSATHPGFNPQRRWRTRAVLVASARSPAPPAQLHAALIARLPCQPSPSCSPSPHASSLPSCGTSSHSVAPVTPQTQ